MKIPEPVPGLVIQYSYLWREEHRRGREEGVKDRPCAIVLVTTDEDGEPLVTVLPVTHSPPPDPGLALEIPLATKSRLGLDSERSWIVLSEANRFVWPGPDLRPTRARDPASFAYGLLPRDLFVKMRNRFVELLRARRASALTRSE